MAERNLKPFCKSRELRRQYNLCYKKFQIPLFQKLIIFVLAAFLAKELLLSLQEDSVMPYETNLTIVQSRISLADYTISSRPKNCFRNPVAISNFLDRYNYSVKSISLSADESRDKACCQQEFSTELLVGEETDTDCPKISGSVRLLCPAESKLKDSMSPFNISVAAMVMSHLNYLLDSIIDFNAIRFQYSVSDLPDDGASVPAECRELWKDGALRGTFSFPQDVLDGRTPSREDLLLLSYIANCVSDAAALQASSNYEDLGTCLIPDRLAALKAKTVELDALSKVKDSLLAPESLCKINASLIGRLREMTDVTSSTRSLGTQLLQFIMEDPVVHSEMFQVENQIVAEIDGRVSVVLSEYDRHCGKRTTVDELLGHDEKDMVFFGNSPIQSLVVHKSECRCYLWASFVNGRSAFLKTFGSAIHRSNQGLGEIASFYIDRLIGLNRYPTVSVRRLYMNSSRHPASFLEPKNSFAKVLDMPLKTLRELSNTIQFDPTVGKHFVTVAVIPKIVKGVAEVTTVAGSQLAFIFMHMRSLVDQERYPLQLVRDAADVIVLDFLTHNVDRPVVKNWFMTEQRLFPFDNGAAFWPSVNTSVCKVLLHCPSCICPQHMNGQNTSLCEVENPGQFLQKKPCLFNKLLISRIRGFNDIFSVSIGDAFRRYLHSRDELLRPHMSEAHIDEMASQLDLRVQYLLDYVNDCYTDYGESIYIT